MCFLFSLYFRSTEEVKTANILLETILHTNEYNQFLTSRMGILIGRIAVEYIPHFNQHYKELVTRHIGHTYEDASRQKK